MKTKTKQGANISKTILLVLSISIITVSCNKNKNTPDAFGTFEATEVTVSSEASGKILALNVVEGEQLSLNQTVGAIDSTQLYLRKQQIISSKKSLLTRRPDIKKQIAIIEQQIITAKKELKRFTNLVNANAANQKQLDDIQAQIALLERQLEAQKNSLTTTNEGMTLDSEGLNLQVEQLNDQLTKCKITSPIEGIVLIKYAEMGEVAVPGKALFKIADTNNMILRAYITADQLTKVKIGQKLAVMIDYGKKESKEYAGTLTWISSKSEFTPKTIQTRDERANLVYAVKINVKNDGLIKIGMYGEVIFK